MKNHELALLALGLLAIASLVTADPVPKSDTIVIPGTLNDSMQTAQPFDHSSEYAYGSIQSMAGTLGVRPQSTLSPIWRKINVAETGVLIATLDATPEALFRLEVLNTCNPNLCNPKWVGNLAMCIINVVPGTYYFKITSQINSGTFYLDADAIPGEHYDKADTATQCTPEPVQEEPAPQEPSEARVTGYYVLDGYGVLHAKGNAPKLDAPWFGFDYARAFEPFNSGGYVLGKDGGIHAFGGVPSIPMAGAQGIKHPRDMVLLGRKGNIAPGFYILDGTGKISNFNGAPRINPQWASEGTLQETSRPGWKQTGL